MSSNALAQGHELDAVRVPLQNYLRAHESGEADWMRKAFAADARIVGQLNGQPIAWSVEQYAARFGGKPAADEAQRRRSVEILDLSGDAALAKVVLDYPTMRFVDHMALLKIAGEWKIVSKTFHAQPQAAAAP
ncbi:nuclear transport factor 2 family protein [Paucibacter sediminis]|uniref:Nuclear transport factor 2 family protein n=1 Tax=Paucibacter sediminis TaxID=3019553 RepID=A0AA95NHV0_9BURK|nr:nuclear transport factor 2 family protein [Paucibacter sp. S2-9]WIT12723.1 nuclear transport factor 2 family protein [Paucibacter sp. S2-9]